MFITFEGIDGSGKTTASKHLYNYLLKSKREVILTSEPRCGGLITWAQSLLDIIINENISPFCQLMLINAARKEHIEKIIKPALAKGKIVICDRFIDSTIAYQGYAMGLNIKDIKSIHSIVQNNFMPDKTYFMNTVPKIAALRLKDREYVDNFDNKPIDFLDKIYKGFQSEINLDSNRFILIEPTDNLEKIFNI